MVDNITNMAMAWRWPGALPFVVGPPPSPDKVTRRRRGELPFVEGLPTPAARMARRRGGAAAHRGAPARGAADPGGQLPRVHVSRQDSGFVRVCPAGR